MSEPIDPIAGVPVERRTRQRRSSDRRGTERRQGKAGRNLPAPLAEPAPVADEAGSALITAQLIGQKGVRRGLRGGKPVLDEARSAYLEVEWSGPSDRRKRAGKIAKTEV